MFFFFFFKHFLDLERAKTDPRARLKHINVETREALAELDRTYKVPELSKLEDQSTAKADKFNAAPFSTGKVAASFTSTAWERETVHEPAILEDDIVR
jgi:peptidyl-prolyl cis-trans isomerase-like protein 2